MHTHLAPLPGMWRHLDGGDPAGGPTPAPAPTPAAPAPPQPATPPTPAPAAPQPPTPSPVPAGPSGTTQQAPPPVPAPATPPNFDQWLQDPVNAGFVKTLRDEAAGHRTAKRDAEQQRDAILNAVMTAAGLQQDGKPDPAKVTEQLQQQLQARDAELRELRVTNALSTVLGKHGADPGLTRAVLLADGTLGRLDPAGPDFANALEAAVIQALGQYPALRVAGQAPAPAPTPASAPPTLPAPPVSGGQFNGPGAPNGKPQLAREQLKGMTPDEIQAAREAGQLDALLGRL